MAVAFDEQVTSPKLTIGRGGNSAVRQGFVAWEDTGAFAEEVFPVTPEGPQVPASYPGRDRLIAESLEMVPFPNKETSNGSLTLSTLPSYEKALCTINYSTRQDPGLDDGQNQEQDPTPLGS